jgi:uncharacterized protein (TIGR02284 family)
LSFYRVAFQFLFSDQPEIESNTYAVLTHRRGTAFSEASRQAKEALTSAMEKMTGTTRAKAHASLDLIGGDMGIDVIAVLNDLIETSKDGERGFMKAAEDARDANVNEVLLDSAARCTQGARILQDLVLKLGGKPEGGGSVAGALHRGWIDMKAAIGSRTDYAILIDCEKGEDAAKKRFRDALDQDLPVDVRTVVEPLYAGVLQNHDRIRALRDQYADVND